MSYIDSYKHLEKLCNEIYDNNKGISSYIDEMKSIQNGRFYVKDWNDDLEKLRSYKHIRNQIVHEPGFSELNMCNPEDEIWLNNFGRVKFFL